MMGHAIHIGHSMPGIDRIIKKIRHTNIAMIQTTQDLHIIKNDLCTKEYEHCSVNERDDLCKPCKKYMEQKAKNIVSYRGWLQRKPTTAGHQ